MPDEVILPATPAGTALELTSRSGVELVVVAERVGLPYRVRPMSGTLVVIVVVIGVLVAVSWDAPPGPEPGVLLDLAGKVVVLAGAVVAHRVIARFQRWAVRRAEGPWKVGVVAPDPGRAPRGQWVLHSERLPAGVDPRERVEELAEDVRSGRFDANSRVAGLRASLRR